MKLEAVCHFFRQVFNFRYLAHNWIAILALVFSFGSVWALYRVDYGLNAYVKLSKIPEEGDSDLSLFVTLINSGNQSALISDIGFCYDFADDDLLDDPCSQIFYGKDPDNDELIAPIVLKEGDILSKKIVFKKVIPEPGEWFLEDEGRASIDLKMFFTIVNSKGVIYKRYKEESNVSFTVSPKRYMWFNNRSSVGTDGYVIDLAYHEGDFFYEELVDFIGDIPYMLQ